MYINVLQFANALVSMIWDDIGRIICEELLNALSLGVASPEVLEALRGWLMISPVRQKGDKHQIWR